MKKKAVSILLTMAMTAAALSGCGSTGESADSTQSTENAEETSAGDTAADESEGSAYKVAVVKQMDHASLDEIANAVCEELDQLAQDNGVTIEYEVYSGQGDQSVLNQIGTQVIADGVDVVIPVATLAAQVMAVCAEDTQTPVVYAAISDPEAAEMTGIDYVTGTSDALNTEFILDMMLAQNPDVQKVGLLYSLSEANSETPIAEAKAYLDEKGIAYEEMTGNTNDEVIAAAEEAEMTIILWSIDTRDWAGNSVEHIVEEVMNVVQPGDIILFHDYASGADYVTPEALRVLLPQLRAAGYEMVTISKLLGREDS